MAVGCLENERLEGWMLSFGGLTVLVQLLMLSTHNGRQKLMATIIVFLHGCNLNNA